MVYMGSLRPLSYKRGENIPRRELTSELCRVRFSRKNSKILLTVLHKAGYIEFGGGRIFVKKNFSLEK